MLNTLVYNSLSLNISQQIGPLMDAAIRCLHLLYERDSRHQFCPPALWLAPARKNRPPIAVAARTHEVLSATSRSDDSLAVGGMRSVITTTPHIFPFEERYVQGDTFHLPLRSSTDRWGNSYLLGSPCGFHVLYIVNSCDI